MSQDIYSTTSLPRVSPAEIRQQYESEILLRFVHISDTHISADPSYSLPEADHTPLEGAQELVRQINALPFTPDFVLHTGDVAYDPVSSAYQTARDVLGQIRYPIHYLIGNHDDKTLLQQVMLDRTEIVAPFDYQFEVNGVQIVCLDSNGPAKLPGGALLPSQLDWLEGICKAPDERPLVVAVHHNVLPIGSPFWDDFMRLTNGEDMHRLLLLAQKRVRGVFFGHVHQPTETYRDGILYSSVLSSWYQLHCWPGQTTIEADRGADPGFNVVTITRTQTFIRRHRFHVHAANKAATKTTSSADSA